MELVRWYPPPGGVVRREAYSCHELLPLSMSIELLLRSVAVIDLFRMEGWARTSGITGGLAMVSLFLVFISTILEPMRMRRRLWSSRNDSSDSENCSSSTMVVPSSGSPFKMCERRSETATTPITSPDSSSSGAGRADVSSLRTTMPMELRASRSACSARSTEEFDDTKTLGDLATSPNLRRPPLSTSSIVSAPTTSQATVKLPLGGSSTRSTKYWPGLICLRTSAARS
mmetsp:Transcript_28653/g.43340  ORF Transcript_28653/g.43340 Transcript_28653/m.43340 type:complete len:229 (-) Transcript_28653:48-734(-)